MTPQPTNPDEPKSEEQNLDRLANIMMRALLERHDVLAKGWYEPVFGKKIHVGNDCPHCGTHFAGLREDIKRLFKYYAEQYASSAPQPANPLPSGTQSYKHHDCDKAIVEGRLDDACSGCKSHPTTPIESDELDVFLSARFWSKIESVDDCWLWVGYRKPSGYGQIYYRGRAVAIHRLVYTALVGDIPKGLVIDHLCRVRNCVNPDHLEVVSPRENTLRGISPPALHARRTHCPQGHAYTLDNLLYPDKVMRGESQRRCKICTKERDKIRWQARRKKLITVTRGADNE